MAGKEAMPDEDPTIEEKAITSTKTSFKKIKEILLDIDFCIFNITQDDERISWPNSQHLFVRRTSRSLKLKRR